MRSLSDRQSTDELDRESGLPVASGIGDSAPDVGYPKPGVGYPAGRNTRKKIAYAATDGFGTVGAELCTPQRISEVDAFARQQTEPLPRIPDDTAPHELSDYDMCPDARLKMNSEQRDKAHSERAVRPDARTYMHSEYDMTTGMQTNMHSEYDATDGARLKSHSESRGKTHPEWSLAHSGPHSKARATGRTSRGASSSPNPHPHPRRRVDERAARGTLFERLSKAVARGSASADASRDARTGASEAGKVSRDVRMAASEKERDKHSARMAAGEAGDDKRGTRAGAGEVGKVSRDARMDASETGDDKRGIRTGAGETFEGKRGARGGLQGEAHRKGEAARRHSRLDSRRRAYGGK